MRTGFSYGVLLLNMNVFPAIFEDINFIKLVLTFRIYERNFFNIYFFIFVCIIFVNWNVFIVAEKIVLVIKKEANLQDVVVTEGSI